MSQRKLVSPSPHTCPVCHRTDIRLRPSGKLYQHARGRGGAGLMFAVCPGSNGLPAADVGLSGVADAHFAAVEKAMEREGSDCDED